MMHNPIYFNPYFNKYPKSQNNINNIIKPLKTPLLPISTNTEPCNNFIEEKKDNIIQDNTNFFEIFGIKLYYDDLLLIALLFFLYTEEITDQWLFIILILLLIN